ncbi:c-type cytochrome domain-containing protein [Maribacter algicola]|uniref:C-type cytochrome domain-containing protein n=1 Tax=Meishania litoralis TaxID=3434685 RepID=A0ACC7LJZ5_9FLAO
MAHTSKNKWVDYTIFGLSVFLIFCLVFEKYIELPVLVAWVGRWHPLILHFPIVLLLIAIFLGLTGKNIPRSLLVVATLTALITAISGFFLGKESTNKGDLLFWHQWLGGGVALLAAVWYWVHGMQKGKDIAAKILQVILACLIVFTGHYGGMVTHGEDFLALPAKREDEKIPDNPLIYEHIVGRILKNNCVSCHNPNKQKGQLLMTSLADLMKGGEVGYTIVPGDPEASELIRRIHLPADEEEHMPPDGKKPLEAYEIEILERWIALGASDTLRLDHLKNNEPLVALVEKLMEPDPKNQWIDLPKVADSTILNLSSDYLTINRVANDSDALSVTAFLPPEYDPKYIMDLQRVAQNIVELDLSGLPIGEKEMAVVSQCVNLEWLELDRTLISDAEIDNLKNLAKLRLLKAYRTNIGDKGITVLKEMPKLERLYLWETNATPQILTDIRSKRPNLLIDNGIADSLKTFFVKKDSVILN